MSYLDDYLEEEFGKLDKKLSQVYKGSQKAIKTELKKYLSNYQSLVKSLQNEVKTGNISESEAKDTLKTTVFTGKTWNKEKTKLATIMYEADVEATDYANSRLDDIYVESRNYGRYETENHYHVDVGMTVLTVATLTSEMKPTPKVVNKVKDIAWNKKTIQTTVLKYTKRLELYDSIAEKTARYICDKNYRNTGNSLQNFLWGVSDEADWESMLDTKLKGIGIQKQWIAYLDDRTRDTHQDLDGQIEDVDAYFIAYGARGRFSIMFPRDPEAVPEMICNCRCRLRKIYPEYENVNDQRRAGVNPREVIPFMSFDEWEDYKSGNSY